MKFSKSSLLPAIIFISFTSCNPCGPGYRYEPPVGTGDGLAVGTLEQANLDPSNIVQAINEINCGRFNEIHSMLIFKNGRLVLEEYFPGYIYQWDAPEYRGEWVRYDKEMMQIVMSCTKSFASACIGIAIDRGFISSEDRSIFDFLPDHQQYKNNGKENISIKHLLTMTSGLEWNEWSAPHGTPANDIDRIYFECSADPVKCVLEREMVNTPGEKFTYNGGGMIILGEILRNASGMNIYDFSMKYLFGPLGVDSISWYQFESGAYATDGSLYMKPRDMLKFGVTFLYGGLWNGERIISADWVEKSSRIFNNNKGIKIPIEDSGKNGYGYTWWTSEFKLKGKKIKMYRANGWGGQAIMVFPGLDMVVVFTGGNYSDNSSLFKLLKRHVLPAVNM